MGQTDNRTGQQAASESHQRADNKVAGAVAGTALFMLGLSFAAVPLYSLFCQVTGYGGTTQRATSLPEKISDQSITVRFDANSARGIGWKFKPVQYEITMKIGENKLAFYTATNPGKTASVGTATFNVTPEVAGRYFNKVECFCFTEQTLQPGETVEMPVSFFIDPAILEDEDAQKVSEITLSYTFFPVKKKAGDLAYKASGEGGAKKGI